MTSPNAYWSATVDIDFVSTGRQEVRGPFEALILLTDHWPYRQGIRFVRARSACRGALAGYMPLEEARVAFVVAVDEARDHMSQQQPLGENQLFRPATIPKV